jgi:ubiquinone/menaquinone biosynthesis C-methylase UbiE
VDSRSFESEWRKRFEEFARAESTDAGIAGWSETGLQTRVRIFRKYWRNPVVGEKWLDLGCGAGTYSRLLASQKLEVVGVDYSPNALVKARSRSKHSVAWLSADASRLPFADRSFDGILCLGVTQAIAETFPLATEAARVLRPRGEMWIDALNRASFVNAVTITTRRLRQLPERLRYLRVASLSRSLEQAGFTAIAVYWVPMAPAKWPRLQRTLESSTVETAFRAVPALASLFSHSFLVRARR